MKKITFLLLSLLLSQWGIAQIGILDTTFADNGKYIFFDANSDPLTYVSDAIIDNNGNILVSGNTSSPFASSGGFVMKISQNGVLIPGFGTNGILSFSGNPEIPGIIDCLAQKSDGNYTILSSTWEGSTNTLTFYLNEISPDGQLIPGFGNGNNHFSVQGSVFSTAMKISPQGKTWVLFNMLNVPGTFTTSANVYARQFNSDGTLNTSFGNSGLFEFGQDEPDDRCYDMAFDAEDNAYLTGNQRLTTSFGSLSTILTLCINAGGQLESGFGNNGVFTYNDNVATFGSNSIEVLSNGDIILAGFRYEPFVAQNSIIAKLNSNGEFISSFGNQGILFTNLDGDDEMKSLQVLSDGRILVLGYVQSQNTDDDIFVGSFSMNGLPTPDFGNNGYTAAWDMDGGEDKPKRILSSPDGGAVFCVGDGFSQGINLTIGEYGFILKYLNDIVSGIPGIETQDYSIYPNPATESFFINNYESIVQLELLDASGRMMLSKNGLSSNKLDLDFLSPGIYILKINTKDNRFLTRKIVKN